MVGYGQSSSDRLPHSYLRPNPPYSLNIQNFPNFPTLPTSLPIHPYAHQNLERPPLYRPHRRL